MFSLVPLGSILFRLTSSAGKLLEKLTTCQLNYNYLYKCIKFSPKKKKKKTLLKEQKLMKEIKKTLCGIFKKMYIFFGHKIFKKISINIIFYKGVVEYSRHDDCWMILLKTAH
jgi:L-lysine 2,3-aminomutase